MRQETGSNPHLPNNMISVRLPSGGDPFIVDLFRAQLKECEAKSLRVELLTKRAMLIPTSMFSKGDDAVELAQRELSSIGVNLYSDEQIVRLTNDQITALVVVPCDLICEIEARYEVDQVSYELPLLRNAIVRERHMVIDTFGELSTIKVFGDDGELLFADLYDTPTVASVIYWVQRVSAALSLDAECRVYISRSVGTLKRLLSRNFKNIMICE